VSGGRFEIIHVPVPGGGFIVRDNYAMPIPLIAGGSRFKYNRHQPHSRYYDTREDAIAVAMWLIERAAGYPPSRELVENPRF
jgi:hypothetical protein